MGHGTEGVHGRSPGFARKGFSIIRWTEIIEFVVASKESRDLDSQHCDHSAQTRIFGIVADRGKLGLACEWQKQHLQTQQGHQSKVKASRDEWEHRGPPGASI